MKKSDAIREVVKTGLHKSNKQIKKEVRTRFGEIVSSSQIINVVGSHSDRMKLASYSIDIRKKAKEFLRMVGDYEQAKQLLAMAETDS